MLESQELNVLHVVPGLDEVGNGISVAAKLIANEQGADLVEARLFAGGKCDALQYDEVWVHSSWTPMVLRSCWRVLKSGKRLVRMAHANYDPVRLRYHGWKKWLVGPIERFCLRRCNKIVATCEAEKGWIESYVGRCCPPVEVTDIKRFFKLGSGGVVSGGVVSGGVVSGGVVSGGVVSGGVGELGGDSLKPLHLLYLGRRHPLKGVEYLEAAVRQIQDSSAYSASPRLCVKIVSAAFGEELEKVWEWCDVLILPTLSDNFGLVIAEALERGKRVITTDGAPAWGEGLELGVGSGGVEELRVESGGAGSGGVGSGIWSGYGGRLIYLKGYRDGSSEDRVHLLKSAIDRLFLTIDKRAHQA